jgi:hypothetical protein
VAVNLELLGSSVRDYHDWRGQVERYYARTPHAAFLRKSNRRFEEILLEPGYPNLFRIREIGSPIVAWCLRATEPNNSAQVFVKQYQKMMSMVQAGHSTRRSLRICLDSNSLAALVPPVVQPGDVLIRFRGCDAAVAARPVSASSADKRPNNECRTFMLLARVAVAGTPERTTSPGVDQLEQAVTESVNRLVGGDSQDTTSDIVNRNVYMDLDWFTLQMISAPIF